jgi:hypothetical protein
MVFRSFLEYALKPGFFLSHVIKGRIPSEALVKLKSLLAI